MGAEKKLEIISDEFQTEESNSLIDLRNQLQDLVDLIDGKNNEKISLSEIQVNFEEKSLQNVTESLNKNRKEIFESLTKITDNIIETVKCMTSSSQVLDLISTDTKHLSDFSSTIASAGEELSATINTISHNIDNTKGASQKAKELAVSGDDIIKETLNRINNVNDVMASTNASLEKLKQTAEQANTIVRVVNDISSKTDLLALNASIEAARAGAAGKGFAVVAHEVGRLSEKTQSSIHEIEQILKNIQNNVDSVSKDLEIGTSSSNDALNKVAEAKETIDNIVQQIDFVDNEVSNIGSAVTEQGEAVTDIANNVTTFSKASKELVDKVENMGDILDRATSVSNSTRNSLAIFELGERNVMLQSQVDHLFWMHRLRRMLEGKETIKQEEFSDHSKCRLGKWYLSLDTSEKSSTFTELFKSLDHPHEQLHRIAAQVISLYNSDNKEEALKKYKECLPISVNIIRILDEMVKES